MDDVRLGAVAKRFGDTVAVDAIDLQLKAGSLSTLLGPSGCGKTTTLRMIAGLEHPTSGRIAIGERYVFDEGVIVPAERREIGMVFQSYAVWPHLTVFENVAYPLRIRRRPAAEIAERVGAALRTVRLDALAERYPAQISGGQQQRVALARAIVYAPRLLLLDEPLSNLDAQLRDEMREEIRALQRRLGITAVYVTHDQAEALAISDFVAVMNHGRIIQQGSPRAIYGEPQSRFVAQFLGWTNFLAAQRIDDARARVLDWTVALPDSLRNASGTGALCAAIRPDHLELGPAGAADHRPGRLAVAARVSGVTFFGSSCAVDLDAAGHVLQARLAAEAAPPVGADVVASLAADRLRLMRDDVDGAG